MIDTHTTPAINNLMPVNRSRTQTPLRQQAGLLVVLLISIFMNFYQLGQHGFGKTFYAAGVRSMADSLHNFFFVSYDPGGFVALDKPPLGFWLQTISVKLCGFTPFSIFLPQALAGVLAVVVLFHLVQRHFGYRAGLLAALALALSPLSVATARNNTIDSTLALVLLLGAWAILRAAETGQWRWLLLSAGLVGLGFNVKMLEAYLVIPPFGLLYLLAAPRKFWTRVGQLFVAGLLLLAISLSWAIAVDMTPASQRPYVGSSQNNSEMDLAFGYNGLDLLLRRPGDILFSHTDNTIQVAERQRAAMDAPGIFRLFNQSVGGQISWLLPFALLGLLALAWQRFPRFKKDKQQQSLLLWGTWLLTMGVFFSVAGFFHSYYMTTFAPAICALFGIGAVVMWQDYRRTGWRGWLLPIALLATAAEQIHFIASNPGWGLWLLPLIALPCVLAALVLSVTRLLAHLVRSWRLLQPMFGVGIAALLLTPAIWSAMPALQNTASSIPVAGPPQQHHSTRYNAAANPNLLDYLKEHQGNATYLVATPDSRSADSLILATNKPVMALGGFAGSDFILTTSQLAALVTRGTVRFFLLNNPSDQAQPLGDRNSSSFLSFGRPVQTVLTTWVTDHCLTVPASQWQSATSSNTMLLYDCAAGRAIR